MSRIGKKTIALPKGVDVTVNEGNVVTVKGPKGTLSRQINPDLVIDLENGEINVRRPSDERHHKALHGLSRALLNNMVQGVSEGYEKRLEITGTGYRAEMEGNNLRLALGYSHDIIIVPPPGLTFVVENRGNSLIIRSHNKELLGMIAADIRKLRPPEPYKGKGIRYSDETVRRKAGKSKA
jgi:large subunit ribosomal protein L6